VWEVAKQRDYSHISSGQERGTTPRGQTSAAAQRPAIPLLGRTGTHKNIHAALLLPAPKWEENTDAHE